MCLVFAALSDTAVSNAGNVMTIVMSAASTCLYDLILPPKAKIQWSRCQTKLTVDGISVSLSSESQATSSHAQAV